MTARTHAPWYDPPPPLEKGAHVVIIGGGIAGLTTAAALEKQGFPVTVVEENNTVMAAASGNPAAILDPFFSAVESPEGRFSRMALDFALSYYQAFEEEIFIPTGLKKKALNEKQKLRFEKITRSGILPKSLMREDQHGHPFFPSLGLILPKKLSAALCRNIPIILKQKIDHMRFEDQWILYDKTGTEILKADAVVLTGGHAARFFQQSASLPISPLRGQISYLTAEKPPKNIICGENYLTPPVRTPMGPAMISGATFEPNSLDCDLRLKDHEQNMQHAQKLWPDMGEPDLIGGRAAIRGVSPDHMPLCGPLPIATQYEVEYAMLKHGPRHQNFAKAPYYPGLYTICGLGTRGFLTAPLLAEILTAIIGGKPVPTPRKIQHALHPARFLIRKLIKT